MTKWSCRHGHGGHTGFLPMETAVAGHCVLLCAVTTACARVACCWRSVCPGQWRQPGHCLSLAPVETSLWSDEEPRLWRWGGPGPLQVQLHHICHMWQEWFKLNIEPMKWNLGITMTISYQRDVASSTAGGFTRLLFKWKVNLCQYYEYLKSQVKISLFFLSANGQDIIHMSNVIIQGVHKKHSCFCWHPTWMRQLVS